eukprot:5039266-Lingulodinium_polyedra.AAC.1
MPRGSRAPAATWHGRVQQAAQQAGPAAGGESARVGLDGPVKGAVVARGEGLEPSRRRVIRSPNRSAPARLVSSVDLRGSL